MIVAGALLVTVSVAQHQHHDHAVAAQAARKAEVDRTAVVEALQFLAAAPPRGGQGGPSAKVAQRPSAQAPQLRATARVPALDRRAGGGRASRPLPTAQPRPAGTTNRGAVSEVGREGATLVIPALRVRAPIVATGAVDGSMTIPADIHTVGWYDGIDITGGKATSGPAPWPGQPGVSLLAGHVDWSGEGPGALYYIGQLVVGDPLEVIGSNRQTTYWRVSEAPITLPKAELPADLFVNTGPPKLALVTCGGPFDSDTRHYLDNVIVWATLAAP
jgi:Sortase domain